MFPVIFSNPTEVQTSFIEFSLDRDGKLIYASDSFNSLLGYTANEIIGTDIRNLTLNGFQQSGDQTANATFVCIFIKKSGERESVLVNKMPVIADGATVGVFVSTVLEAEDSQVTGWIKSQSSDIQLLLKNLVVKITDDRDIVVECPNAHWFKLINAMRHHFRHVSLLELSVPQTGDFQVIKFQEPIPHTFDPTP